MGLEPSEDGVVMAEGEHSNALTPARNVTGAVSRLLPCPLLCESHSILTPTTHGYSAAEP